MASISSSLLPSSNITATPTKVTVETIETVSLTTAATEVSHTLPNGTVGYVVLNRDNGLVKLGFTLGSTSTSDYLTLYPGIPYNSPLSGAILDTGTSFTIYLQSPKANQTIEILSWQ